MLSSSSRVTRGLDLPLEEVGHLLVEDLRGRRVAHVVALGVVLGGIDVGGGDALLLDPEAVDVVLEAQPGREERRQAEGVVVAGHAAVHPPVLLGHHRAEVDQHVQLVQVVRVRSAPRRRGTCRRSRWRRCRWCPERNVWAILTTASSAHRPALEHQRVLARQPLGGVGLQVHRGVDEQLAALVVVRHLAGRLAQHVEERARGCRTTCGV